MKNSCQISWGSRANINAEERFFPFEDHLMHLHLKYFGYLKKREGIYLWETFQLTYQGRRWSNCSNAPLLILIQPFRDLLNECDEPEQITGWFGDFSCSFHWNKQFDKCVRQDIVNGMYFRVTWNWVRLDQSNYHCVWSLNPLFYCFHSSFKHQYRETVQVREEKQDGAEKQSGREKGWRIRKTKTGKKGKKEGELYLDNPIISYLQSTSTDAPSLHQAAHCEDRASGAGQPVDFPLSLSQKGAACPYISRSGHADSHGHPSATTQQYHRTMTPGIKILYTNIWCTDHIYMLTQKILVALEGAWCKTALWIYYIKLIGPHGYIVSRDHPPSCYFCQRIYKSSYIWSPLMKLTEITNILTAKSKKAWFILSSTCAASLIYCDSKFSLHGQCKTPWTQHTAQHIHTKSGL